MLTRFSICVLFLLVNVIKAQDVVYDHIFKNDQLPSIVYYDIIEDDKNNIWLASDDGLVKYNGDEFISYTYKDQRSLTVFNLKVDNNGVLWCNNLYGQILYVERDRLQLFYDAHDLTRGQLSPFTVTDNIVQLYTRDNGIFNIDKRTKKVHKISSREVLSMTSTTNKTYVITHKPTVESFRVDNLIDGKLRLYANIDLKGSIAPVLSASEDILLVNYKLDNDNKLELIKEGAAPITLDLPKELKESRIYKIKFFDKKLWFCTSDGILIYTLKNNVLVQPEHILKSQSISNVIMDFNDNLWATSLDNGVFIVSDIKMRRYDLNNSKERITSTCLTDNNKILIGTSLGSIYEYSTTDYLKKYQLDDAAYIEHLYYDKNKKNVIISGVGIGSYQLDITSMRAVHKSSRFNSAKTIERINDSSLFYGNFKEALLYKTVDGHSYSTTTLRKQRVKEALVLDQHRLVIAFIDGTFLYDTRSNSLNELTINNAPIYANSLALQQENLWIATKSGSLLLGVIDSAGLRFRESEITTTTADNKHHILNHLKVHDGFLWLLSQGNLMRYDPQIKELKKVIDYNAFDDVINGYVIKEKEIVAFSSTAMYTIPREIINRRYITSPIEITEVIIEDHSVAIDSLSDLEYSQNMIQISFNSTGYRNNDMIYQYKITDNDETWRTVPKGQKKLAFASLSHGTYTFRLRGKRPSSRDYQYAAPLTFTIHPPYWQSYWFISLLAVLLVVVVYGTMRQFQKKKNRKRRQQLEQLLMDKRLTSLKLENIRSQMNPHFVFNSLNSIQDFILSNERDLASSYLVKFSRLIRMYLEYSQQDEITFNQEINALKLYLELEKMRFDDELEYNIIIDPTLDGDRFKIPSLFIQPYVENALKHGLLHKKRDRLLLIKSTLLNKERLVEIIIEDNGIGRVKSNTLNKIKAGAHRSFATAVNDERVKLYKEQLNMRVNITIKDLYDDRGDAVGTRVILTFPCY